MPGTLTTYKSLLHQMTQTTPTCLWNDSAAVAELTYAIEHGGVGATCNPVIVVEGLQKEKAIWSGRIRQLVQDLPAATEDALAWRVVEEMSIKSAELLRPIFDTHRGKNGRLSVQTDPRLFRDPDAILAQSVRFAALAPNIIVKIPATSFGLVAIEEATAQGISINATVSFSLPQAVAVAEAVERGLDRRTRGGHDVSTMGPVCTIMVGRLDDWMKSVVEKRNLSLDPGVLEWAGVAVFKRTYELYRQRGYRTRLLSAAFRNHMHWSEFIGGDVVISPPHKWQVRFNASGIPVVPRMDRPVAADTLASLLTLDDFRRAYEDGGMTPREFDTFGPTVRTLRQFSAACADLNAFIRDFLLPDPEKLA